MSLNYFLWWKIKVLFWDPAAHGNFMTDFDRERKRNLSKIKIKKEKKLHLLFPQIAFTNGADELKKEFISST